MFVFLIMNIVLIAFIGVGCKKKKNNASKLKPRDFSKEKQGSKSPDTNKPSPATTSPNPEAEKPKKPDSDEPPMAPREADDNETINEAPSCWGPVNS